MVAWIKAHPFLAGGLTLGLLFLFIALKNSSSSSAGQQVATTGGPSDALQAASLAANVQQQQTQVAAQVQTHAVDVAGALQSQQSTDALTALTTSGAYQLSAINTQAQAQTDQAGILANASIAQGKIAQAVAANQNASDIQRAQITGGFSFAAAQAAAAAQETETLSTNASQLAAIQAQVGGDVSIAGIQANRDLGLATTAAGVADIQSGNALSAQKDIDTASILNNRSDNSTSIALKTLDTNVQNNSISAWLAGMLDTNKTNLAITNSNNGTIQNVTQINANRDVNLAGITTAATTAQTLINANSADNETNTIAQLYQHLIDVNGNIATDQINSNYNLQSSILADFHTTDFNRGGQGGANQVAAWSALLGQPAVGAAAEQAGGQGFNWGNFLTGLGNLFAGIGKGAQGVGVGAGTAGIAVTH
jgi:hypothetical protein